VKKLRKQLAQELGLVIPPVRVVDNLTLAHGDYAIKLYGVDAAKGSVLADRLMAIDAGGLANMPGATETKEPVFGLKAFWIAPEERSRAEARGLTVVDPSTVLTTHLAEVLRRSAAQLLGRDQVHELVGFVKQDAPKLVEELIPGQLSLGDVVGVLQRLLAERVSVRNLRVILEAVASAVGRTKNLGDLAEAARAALGRQITASVADPEGVVHALVLDRDLEHTLRASMSPTGAMLPDPQVYQQLLRQLADTFASASSGRHPPCLLVADELRRPLRELIEMRLPDISVLALRELDRQAELRVAGTVSVKLGR
jgi:flagellar biosynthesis protein FlhA